LVRNIWNLWKNFLLNFLLIIHYDLNYIKKLIKETEQERKKGKLIEAENIEKALRNTKRPICI
jgi:hypothetical protein